MIPEIWPYKTVSVLTTKQNKNKSPSKKSFKTTSSEVWIS